MDSTKISTRTCAEAKTWLDDFGVSVAEWAQLHGFPKQLVYAVLSGRNRGSRGQAFEVAVELGIRKRPPMDVISPRVISAKNQICEMDPASTAGRKETDMSP